jgi:photosystem II stability/assembly factor-like uncharacterized protein
MKRTAIILFLAVLPLAAQVPGPQPVDINGVWRSNVGRTYEIRQTGETFTWIVPGGSQRAQGTINGLNISASWMEDQADRSATGVIVLGPDRRAVRIEWTDGVVFVRAEGGPGEEGNSPLGPPPPQGEHPPEGKPPGELTIQVGGPWHGSNGLTYDYVQRGLNFEYRASDGSKGKGKLGKDMKIEASFPKHRSVKGRVFVGPEPGLAVAIEFEGGLVLNREPPPPPPGPGQGPGPKPGGPGGPPGPDLSGRWSGSDNSEAEVVREGPDFVWRSVKTGQSFRLHIEGDRLRSEAGPGHPPLEVRILESEGARVTKVRWTDGTVFSWSPGPMPGAKAVQAERIVPGQAQMALLELQALKAKVYNVWVKLGGPLGGLGYDVRFSANTAAGKKIVYVTDNYSGVNRSNDGGATWSATNNGINARTGTSGDAIPVFSLTVDPNNPQIVWAGLKDVSGAYKSMDGGKTWKDVSPQGAGNFVYRGFTIMPGNSNVVFAAGEVPMNIQGKAFDKVRGRVYKTEDGGASWRVIWQGENLTRYVLIHPKNHNVIYVSTGIFDREANNSNCKNPVIDGSNLAGSYGARGGLGILKTEDGGKTWRVLGRSNGLSDLYVGTLAMSPKDPNVLLAGCGNNSASHYWDASGQRQELGGAFLTTDGGETWTKTLGGDTITAVDFAWNDPKIAYAGSQHCFYRSVDGGQSWTVVNGSLSHGWGPPGVVSGFPIDILVDPNEAKVLFVNNYGGGNVKSTDGGKNWTVASAGYTGALMFGVDLDPKHPDTVYVGARSGAFRSLNGGRSWEGLSYPPADLPYCYDVALSPANPKIVLASQEQLGALYRSQDGGKTWTTVTQLSVTPGEPLKEYGFKSIVYAPVCQANPNSQIVYAGSARPNNTLSQISSTGGLGVFKSTDGGLTWTEANSSATKSQSINKLAVHPTNPNIVYAATVAGGLCKTTDGGQNWVRLNGLKASDVRTVAIRPDKPSTIYAGLDKGGVSFSPDGGQTWSAVASGMEPNDDIFALVFDPARPDRLWAGSNKTGAYVWDSIEQQWVHFNSGLRTRAVMDLAISADGRVLYATTWGEGVFRLDLKPAGQK